ncbi:uncharacterized protein RJT21DRAFT_13819 [Scheffersomyces amazonensis]|uniref:uncharacterized protein n=1 Tax=Scheffersomyces amazonensis TaxID=1078765 RepID=UPI00315DADE4
MFIINQSLKRLANRGSSPMNVVLSAKSLMRCTILPKRAISTGSLTNPAASKNSLKLLMGCTTSSLVLLGLSKSSLILNDSATALPYNQLQRIEISPKRKHRSRLGGYLNYEELTIGSIIGFFLGVIIGKLSTILVYLTLSTYLLLEYLQTKHIIRIPWNYMFTIGKEKVDVRQLVFEKPSFKIAFALSFLLTAYNI